MLGFGMPCEAPTPPKPAHVGCFAVGGRKKDSEGTDVEPAVVSVKAFHALHQQLSHGQRPQHDGELGPSPSGLGLGYV